MKEEKRSKLQTLLLALLLNLNSIPAAIGRNGTFIVVLFVCYIIALISNSFKVNKGYLLVIIINVICAFSLFLSPNGYNAHAERYLLYGMSLGLFVFIIKLYFDTHLIFRYVVAIGVLLAPLHLLRAISLSSLLAMSDVDTGVMMGLSYAIMPPFLCALLMIFRKETFFWKTLSVILLFSGFIIYMIVGSRGCFVVIIGTILLYFVNKKFKSYKKRVFVVSTLGLIGSIMMNNFIIIIEWLSNALGRIGIEVYAIQKILYYYSQDKMDNGRNELYGIAWKGISESPLGHYIGSFELANDAYVHNLILQMAWDYGIIGFVFICFIYYKSLNYFMRLNSNENNQDICFIVFSSSLITLLFSSTYWLLPCFWLWVKYILNCKRNASNTFF